jgi:predicted MFS family arabinose efflux permease
VREMVSQEHVSNAVSLYSAMVNLSRLVGPALGGLLIVAVGYGWCFTIDASTYLLVILALLAMRTSELRAAPVAPRAKGQIREGFRYVWATRSLRISFLMLLIVGTLSYNFVVTFPLFVERGLHGSGPDYTFVYSVFSVGALIGTLVVARRRTVGSRYLIGSAACFGAAMLILAAAPNVAVAYPLAALTGGTSVAYMTATTTVAQLRSAPSMVGRVIALQTILQFGTTPIGGPILGWLSDAAGGRAPIIAGGIGALAAAALGLWAGDRAKRGSPEEVSGH